MTGAVPRAVLDTNVLLDLYYWRDKGVEPLRTALHDGRVRALTDDACLSELKAVLAYARFALDESGRSDVLRQAMTQVAMWDGVEIRPDLPDFPRCTDAHDQKFLTLAWRCGAAMLISKDKAVLRLRRKFSRLEAFEIMTPSRFAALNASD